jgi:hypothetical protein
VTRSRALLACLACLVAVTVFPATGLAQTAGQAEYGGVAGATAQSPTSGTAAETASGTTPKKKRPREPAGVASRTSNGSLPFTGRDLGLMLIAGIALVGLGVVLRSAARAPAGA